MYFLIDIYTYLQLALYYKDALNVPATDVHTKIISI